MSECFGLCQGQRDLAEVCLLQGMVIPQICELFCLALPMQKGLTVLILSLQRAVKGPIPFLGRHDNTGFGRPRNKSMPDKNFAMR